MKLINLTPHELNIQAQSSATKEGSFVAIPSTGLARCAETRLTAPHVTDPELEATFAVSVATYGDVEGLPAPVPGVGYIVSAIVLARVQDRVDVFAPGEAIRDSDGKIIGCKGLSATTAYLQADLAVRTAEQVATEADIVAYKQHDAVTAARAKNQAFAAKHEANRENSAKVSPFAGLFDKRNAERDRIAAERERLANDPANLAAVALDKARESARWDALTPEQQRQERADAAALLHDSDKHD